MKLKKRQRDDSDFSITEKLIATLERDGVPNAYKTNRFIAFLIEKLIDDELIEESEVIAILNTVKSIQ